MPCCNLGIIKVRYDVCFHEQPREDQEAYQHVTSRTRLFNSSRQGNPTDLSFPASNKKILSASTHECRQRSFGSICMWMTNLSSVSDNYCLTILSLTHRRSPHTQAAHTTWDCRRERTERRSRQQRPDKNGDTAHQSYARYRT